ncbi:hypothetical protein ACG95N_13990 [Acinetobacter guillouiae]|uniref:hypothetical protein n=1 Tax=Acinetobacter guillouiae TaxID=106649 RepID=UPI003AF522AF
MEQSIKMYVRAISGICENFEIDFNEFEKNPILLANRIILGDFIIDEVDNALEYFWCYIENKGALGDFSNKDILKARMAISMLKVDTCDDDALSESLSWFIELTRKYGLNQTKVGEKLFFYFNMEK